MAGRILAVGDIHGCEISLGRLLQELHPDQEDTVVLLGDVVDRGPATRQVLERLIKLRGETNLVCVRGNHEEMMLRGLTDPKHYGFWISAGGQEALRSYGGKKEQIDPGHLRFIQDEFIDYFETPQSIFVHGSLEENVPLSEQRPEYLRWSRYTGKEPPWPTGQRVICGHTPQISGLPAISPGWVCLDTFVYGPGWLTCLDLTTDEMHQANEAGRYRHGQLG